MMRNLLDDRNNHLNASVATYKIKFDTNYEQDAILYQQGLKLTTGSWQEILYEVGKIDRLFSKGVVR